MTTPITKIIRTFRKHLKKQRKHPNTIRSYSSDVELFVDWLSNTIGSGFSLNDVTVSDMKDFKTFLLTRNASATSVNRRLTALRRFFEFAIDQQFTTINPVADIPALTPATQLPALLSRKEQLLLLRTVEKSMRPLEASILLLLLHAGLRSNEICALTIGDLHLTPRKAKLFIRSVQGRKIRFVELTPRTQAALRMYCKRKGISILARIRRDETLFVQSSGHSLTQQYIDHIVKRIGKLAGIVYVTPTMLRNTYAIQILLNGESPDKVGRTLGIRSVKGLQRMAEMIRQQEQAS